LKTGKPEALKINVGTAVAPPVGPPATTVKVSLLAARLMHPGSATPAAATPAPQATAPAPKPRAARRPAAVAPAPTVPAPAAETPPATSNTGE
jgi:hypothetical protein